MSDPVTPPTTPPATPPALPPTPVTGPAQISSEERERIAREAIRGFQQDVFGKTISREEARRLLDLEKANDPQAKAEAAEVARLKAIEGEWKASKQAAFDAAHAALSDAEKAMFAELNPEADKMAPDVKLKAIERAKATAAKFAPATQPQPKPALPGVGPSGGGAVTADVQSRVDQLYAAARAAGKDSPQADAYMAHMRELASKNIKVVPTGHVSSAAFAEAKRKAGYGG